MIVTKKLIDGLNPKLGDEIVVKRNRVTLSGSYARHDEDTLYLMSVEHIPHAYGVGETKNVETPYRYRELTEVRMFKEEHVETVAWRL